MCSDDWEGTPVGVGLTPSGNPASLLSCPLQSWCWHPTQERLWDVDWGKEVKDWAPIRVQRQMGRCSARGGGVPWCNVRAAVEPQRAVWCSAGKRVWW